MFVRASILLALALTPTLQVAGQGPPGVSGLPGSSGTYPNAPAYYDEPFVGYQSQSAVQTGSQRDAAATVLENNIGYSLRAPFGPRLGFDGIFGDRRGIEGNDYSVYGFLPWHIDPGRNVVFANLRGTATDLGDFVGNFGLGHRVYVEEWNRIFGINGWYDIDDSHNQTYHRAGGQLEYFGRYLEIRAGADIVLDTNQQVLQSGFTPAAPFFRGNNVLFTFSTTQELAYDQAYIEAGGPMPFLGRYGVNAYGGAYYAWHDDADETLGWTARASADITRDVQVGVRHTSDDIFGHNTSVNVTLSFPNGGLKQVIRSPRTIVRGQNQNLNETNQVLKLRPNSVASLMGSNVFRDHRLPVDIATNFSNIAAIDPLTGAPVCVTHVDPNAATQGVGTFEDPFRTLEGARLANDGSCRIIRVVPRGDGTGMNLAVADTFTLFTNQRLLASSSMHLFDTTRGAFVFPGFTGAGPGPLVTSAVNGDIITMGDNTEVSGFQLVGSATGNAIVGSPTGFNVNRNDIRDSLNGMLLTNTSGLGIVSGNTFRNNINSGAFIESNGGDMLSLIAVDNRFTGNATGLDLQSNTGAVQNVIATGNTFETSTDAGSGGFRAVADMGTINLNSVTDNTFDQNVGNGMLIGVVNGGVVNSVNEDANGNGILDAGEDLNGNGMLDRAIADNTFSDNMGVGLAIRGGEDLNRDGLFTADEDLNGNGVLDGGVGTMVNLDIGGPTLAEGNVFNANLGGAIAFDMMDDSMTTTRIRNNVITFAGGSIGDAIFVMDISASTSFPFGGTPVGDLNSDGNANEILDAEIAGFIALNQRLIDLGGGNTARVALVAFDDMAFQRDMDPVAAGVQLTTNPLTDADGNTIRDVDQALMAEMIGGLTDFELALQASIATFTTAGLTPGGTTLVFLSDGFNGGGVFTDEVAVLNGLGVTTRAFGVGAGAGLFDLQQIDPGAQVVTSTDELLNAFNNIMFTPATDPIDAVRMTFSDTAKMQPSLVENNQISGYGRDGLNVETLNSATVQGIDIRGNTIRSLGRNGTRLAAANTSLINLTSMTDNIMIDNVANGALVEATDTGVVNVASVTGNNFSSNGESGMFLRANGIGATVAGGIGINGAAMNVFNANTGYGINLEASSGGRILGPGGVGNFTIVNNQIGDTGMGNALGGINAIADSNILPPSNSELNLAIGGPTMGDGNMIVNNMDFGIGFLTRTFAKGTVLIQGNVITNTLDNAATPDPNDPMGDGIFLDRGDTSLLTAMVLDNMSMNNANDGLRVLTRGDDPTNVNQPMTGMPNLVTFDRNALTDNMRHGASFAVQADSVLVANGMLNEITGNVGDGVNITSTGDAGFGNPAVGTRSILDGNNISMNMGNGVGVDSSDSSRVFLSVQSSDAVGRTTIMDNTLNGVAINHNSDRNSDIIIQSDPLVANTMFRTLITNNGDSAGAGGNGVLINNTNGSSTFTVQRTDITSNNIDTTMMLNGDGIAINSTGVGTPTFNIGSMAAELGNLIQSNEGDGLSITTDGLSSPTVNVARNTIGAAIGQLAGGNMGHGVNVLLDGTNNGPVLNFYDNDITRNTGRGANILLTGSVGDRDGFGGLVARINFLNGGTGGNVISGNGLEGIFYMADPQIAQDRTISLSNTNEPIAGQNDLTPDLWDNRLAAAPPLDYAADFRNLRTVNDSFLRILDNTIQNNGTRGVDSDGVGGVDGDGVYVRVGTGAYVAADVQDNVFGGNALDDFRTDSFISAPNALSTDNSGAGSFDLVVLKDTAQFDLRFEGNTGNQVNPSAFGATHTNDPLTGNVDAFFFQVDNGFALNVSNEFVQFGPPEQDLDGFTGAFSVGGYSLVPGSAAVFPDPTFPP